MSLHLVEPLDAATYLGQDQGWSIMPVLVLISMMLAVSSNLMIPPPAWQWRRHHSPTASLLLTRSPPHYVFITSCYSFSSYLQAPLRSVFPSSSTSCCRCPQHRWASFWLVICTSITSNRLRESPIRSSLTRPERRCGKTSTVTPVWLLIRGQKSSQTEWTFSYVVFITCKLFTR